MRRMLFFTIPLLVAVLAMAAVRPMTAQQPTAVEKPKSASHPPLVPVTDAVLRNPPPGDWLRWRRDHGATGYSPLDQIDRGNVQKLRLAWAWAMQPGTQEQEPIVHNGVMYLPHSNSVVQALDARTGELFWEYRRELPKDASAGDTVRNIAIYEDKIFLATQDAHLVALNATTGKVVWDLEVADHTKRINYSAGPIAADGKVFAATTCGVGTPFTCFVSAHDAATGKELWRRESVAGPRDPPEHQATWRGLPYEKRLKASLWLTGSYDPDLKLLYWTTASPYPYPEIHKGTRDGELLYSNSILALDAATGAIKWFFQMQPRDNFDMDHEDNPILADVTVNGAMRKLVFVLGKPGILWAFDRQTGQHVWNRQVVTDQNIYSRIDRETGAITMNLSIIPKEIGIVQLVCPGMRGGKLFQTHAYSPKTNALYSPVSNACTNFEIVPLDVNASGVKNEQNAHMKGSNGNVGRLAAVSASTGEVLWTYDQRAAMGSVLTTGGGLVFAGDFHRYFRAFDAETGKVLWEVPLSAPVTAYPISYAVDGKQYVAVAVGGSTSGSRSLAQLYPELKTPNGSNILMVFTLGE
jgi:PQQ-dependent dehydrogenase (methanol/ethanol family)